LIALFGTPDIMAQGSNINEESKSVIYEELYDSPYDINKLYVHIQPVCGELFALNTTGGFGLQAQYYLKDILDIQGHVRIPYASSTDLVRNAAKKNSTVDNTPRGYGYYELTATYHVVDKDYDTETKFILYSKRYKGDKWAATVPLHTVIPTKVRRIYGARLGGFSYKTALDYSMVMRNQSVSITDGDGNPIDSDNNSVYGNLTAYGVHIGGSLALIKNVAVQPDKIYGTLVNDLIFTTYLDILIAPSVNLEDILANGILYDADALQTNILGFRGGMEGKFNRNVGWGYGAEIGWRPGLQKSGFYVLAKMSFPLFSTNLRHQVESFGK
jgi:hypothetical protein